jgi:transcriptional regulator with XRE-family HTH domain
MAILLHWPGKLSIFEIACQPACQTGHSKPEISLFDRLGYVEGMLTEWIKAELKARELTQKELADAIGISDVQMSKSLRGKRKITAPELIGVLQFLGYPVALNEVDAPVARIVRTLASFDEAEQQAVLDHMESLVRLMRKPPLQLPPPPQD